MRGQETIKHLIMKTLIIGDIHGRSSWKLIAHTQEWGRIIFIGDYFDSWDFSLLEQMRNFEDLIAFKIEQEEKGKEVVLLIGNHDFHYWPGIGNQQYSGYQEDAKAIGITALLQEHRDHLRMAYAFDNVLCTHAGVSPLWMENIHTRLEFKEPLPVGVGEISVWVNSMWHYKPLLFAFTGMEPTGDNQCQTPIWIRPRSLMKASQKIKEAGIIQVCGHTTRNKIDIEGKSTGGKYFFIDTLGTSGEYLIHENGEFKTGKV